MKERRQKLLWRTPLIVAILIAIFWGIWYLITGSIPEVTTVKLAGTKNILLPFAMSRLWDILFGTIWTFIIVWIATNEKIREYLEPADLVIGLGVGLVFGVGLGMAVGLCFGLVFTLLFGVPAGLIIGGTFTPDLGLGVGLGAWLGGGLGAGLGIGLVFGVAVSLGICLFFGLSTAGIIGLNALIRFFVPLKKSIGLK